MLDTISKWNGTWIMRGGRKVTFTSNIKSLLLELESFPMQLFSEGWDEETGNSLVDREFDLMERVREAKLTRG